MLTEFVLISGKVRYPAPVPNVILLTLSDETYAFDVKKEAASEVENDEK